MNRIRYGCVRTGRDVICLLLVMAVLFSGCSHTSTRVRGRHGLGERKVFALREITPAQALVFLSRLGLGTAAVVPDRNAVVVTGSYSDLHRAGVVLDLVDTREEYVIEHLAPVSAARTVPTNEQIGDALGGVAIGTFAEPPKPSGRVRAIIDIHGDSVLAIMPARLGRDVITLARLGPDGLRQITRETTLPKPAAQTATAPEPDAMQEASEPNPLPPSAEGASAEIITAQVLPEPLPSHASEERTEEPATPDPDPPAEPKPAGTQVSAVDAPVEAYAEPLTGGVLIPQEPLRRVPEPAAVEAAYELALLANGDDVLKLDLPDRLEMIDLLDLAAKYLNLDCMYEPEKLAGQAITLRLHGKLQGDIRVKDLYPLLESVLKFKGFAMTRHKGNLVTIVPATDALQANPDLIEPGSDVLETGDMVVTSVFDLRNIEVAAATSLLTNMKLSLAVTPVDGMQALIVTCYAHQIERIEQLLDLIDRPGRPREFRSRQLRYTMARSLTQKIKVLAAEMRSVSIAAGPAPKAASNGNRPAPIHQAGQGAGASEAEPVYLDADDRTNRILMIGYREQIAIIEGLVDVLDVAQQDLRVLKIYDVRHVEADEVRKKLQELEIIGGGRASGGGPAGAGKIGGAEAVRDAVTDEPVVVVLEATNSLVVNATEEQHARIEAMMDYLDAEVRTEAIPYEIYFLENQDPDNLAQVLEKIIHETVQDKEGKLQKILRNAEDQIVIVPDKQTFSLIVYASRKNQEWISKLIEALDRERSQVLIDVTLVEIRKSDEFNYDLNWITSIPDLVETGGQTGQFFVDENTTVVEKLLQPGMRSQFVDFEFGSGAATGFYADLHVNALLQLMQKKNYGRVLAKPKVLVNDNQRGTIKTTDTTYVETRSGIPVSSGAVGNQQNFVETSLKYEPYEAGITLEITPHISDGDLLRLEIDLTRSDFGVITGKKPPDQTSSDINTVVTVPDGHTIILGGLLRLNQTKGGNKVPILGDIPLVGMAFRSIANSDMQSKLYIFVKAEIIRPAGVDGQGMADLEAISERSRMALEKHEQEFQTYENWPGIKPEAVGPRKVLEAQ